MKGRFPLPGEHFVTGEEFFELWKQDPRCTATQKMTFLKKTSLHTMAGLDRINNIRAHTIGNCRIMSTKHNKLKGRMTLAAYRY